MKRYVVVWWPNDDQDVTVYGPWRSRVPADRLVEKLEKHAPHTVACVRELEHQSTATIERIKELGDRW